MKMSNKSEKWDFSEWYLPEIDTDKIQLMIKKLVASTVQRIFEDDDFYKEVQLRTRNRRNKKGLFLALSFDPADGTKIVEKEFDVNDYVDACLDNDIYADWGADMLDDLSVELKRMADKIDKRVSEERAKL